MKAYLQAAAALLLIGSATPGLCQQADNSTQSAPQWRANAKVSKCITYDPNDWQYYPLNFQATDTSNQPQPNGTDRVRPKC